MIEAVKGIFDFLKAIFDFVIQLFEGMFKLIGWLTVIPVQLPNLISWLPAVLVSTIMVCIAVAIIFKILGRQT